MSRRSVGVLAAAALVFVGCSAPSAQQSEDLSAAPTPTVAPSDAPAPTTPTPTPSASAVASGSPIPRLAFALPDDILPPLSVAVVIVDALHIREEASLDGRIVTTAAVGEKLFVSGVPGRVVVDGIDWYQVQFISGWDGWPALPPDAQNSWFGWAAGRSGDQPYLSVVEPECPLVDHPALEDLRDMTAWEPLACFGDRILTFEGTLLPGGGMFRGTFEPHWLAYPAAGAYLAADFPDESSGLELRVSPDTPIELPNVGSILRVTGHFNHAAAASCTSTWMDGDLEVTLDPLTAQLTCRMRFVVDTLEVLGTDPDYPSS